MRVTVELGLPERDGVPDKVPVTVNEGVCVALPLWVCDAETVAEEVSVCEGVWAWEDDCVSVTDGVAVPEGVCESVPVEGEM